MFAIGNKNLCESCFSEINSERCPFCGFSAGIYYPDPQVLPCGSILMGRYFVGRVIGKGGFGITYLAYDVKSGSTLAIKEYFPIELAFRNERSPQVRVIKGSEELFRRGSEKFYSEARFLSGFNSQPNIVSVYEFFYENGTVYFTMEYLDGCTLMDHVNNNGPISSDYAVYIAKEVCAALKAVHSENVLHRDISPDNIMLCRNGAVKLIDFGAARQVYPEGSQLLSVILKPGFAPIEQYQRKGKQGPWTDLYALSGSLFFALTGEVPDDPMTRLENNEVFEKTLYGIDDNLRTVIQKACALSVSDRYMSTDEFVNALESSDKKQHTFLSKCSYVLSELSDKKRKQLIVILTSAAALILIIIIILLLT